VGRRFISRFQAQLKIVTNPTLGRSGGVRSFNPRPGLWKKFQEVGNKGPGSFVPLTPMSQERGGFCWHWNVQILGLGTIGFETEQVVSDTPSALMVESHTVRSFSRR